MYCFHIHRWTTGEKNSFTCAPFRPPSLSAALCYCGMWGWGEDRGEGLCKLNIWRRVHLSYLPCLECIGPGLDKHSALMSFIPSYVPYLFTCVTQYLSFFFLGFFLFSPHSLTVSLFYPPVVLVLSHFLPLSVHLSFSNFCYAPSSFQYLGNLRYLSADV